MKKIIASLFFLFSLSYVAFAFDFGLEQENKPTFEIHNRVLLKINNKAITVMDLVRKMEVLFYRQFPDLAEDEIAKFQFYETNYRTILNTMIDDELILADAKEKKIEVTDGDVRESLEDIFGPDVVYNVHRVGLSFEEAWNLLKEELIVRRMVAMMVRSKAIVEVHPAEVKKVYQEKVKANESATDWRYRVMTIEADDQETADRIASKAHEVLTQGGVSLDESLALIKEGNESATVKLSDEYRRDDKSLSEKHKTILSAVALGGYSLPQAAQNTSDNKVVYRIFFLKDKVSKPPISFHEAEEKIMANLTQEITLRHRKKYTKRLREHFGISESYLSQMIPDDFEPFEIR